MSSTSNRFQASHKGRDIFRWHVPRSGTRYSATLEWAMAAQWWHMSWVAFCELDGRDQSFLVAVYRTARQIESVEAWQQNKRMNKVSKPHGT